MKLNFENDSDLIISLAEKAARYYVGITRNANDYEDAKCDAYLIATEIGFDETRSRGERDAYIVKRIVGKLIDVYRKHNDKRVADVDLSDVREERDEPCATTAPDDFESLMEAFDRIANLRVPVNSRRMFLTESERDIILDYIKTKTQGSAPPLSPLKRVARRHGVSQGRASQIMNLFKKRARLMINLGEPKVFIVDVAKQEPSRRDMERTPLFYWRSR